MKKSDWFILLYSFIWVIALDLIHIWFFPPFWSFTTNLFLALIIGALSQIQKFKYTIKETLILAAFPLLILVFILVESIGLLYMPLFILVCYFLSAFVFHKYKSVKIRIMFFSGLMFFSSLIGLYAAPMYYYWLSKEEVRTVKQYDWIGNNGEIVNSSSKKIKILEFWNKGCSACFKKMPMLNELKRELGDDKVQVVCVYIPQENNEEYKAYYNEFLKDTKYDLTFVYDSLYNLHDTTMGVPQTIILNAENEMIHSDAGFIKETEKVVFNNYKSIILNELNTRR